MRYALLIAVVEGYYCGRVKAKVRRGSKRVLEVSVSGPFKGRWIPSFYQSDFAFEGTDARLGSSLGVVKSLSLVLSRTTKSDA